MQEKELIESFFQNNSIAVVGATDNRKKFGYTVLNELMKKGFTVYPVNPKKEIINNLKVFPSVTALPSDVKCALLVIPPKETIKVVKEILSTNINLIWMQQGSESSDAIDFCEKNGISVISKKCVLMYAPPVKSFHKFHRFIWKMAGKI